MDRSRIATVLLSFLSFMALAFVALALIANWAKARPKALGADRGQARHRHPRPAPFV